jgi:hypothetical protein
VIIGGSVIPRRPILLANTLCCVSNVDFGGRCIPWRNPFFEGIISARSSELATILGQRTSCIELVMLEHAKNRSRQCGAGSIVLMIRGSCVLTHFPGKLPTH